MTHAFLSMIGLIWIIDMYNKRVQGKVPKPPNIRYDGNYVSIPKLQQLHRWNLGIDK